MKVVITEPAKEQLRNIYSYYKDLGRGKKGRQIRASILKKSHAP